MEDKKCEGSLLSCVLSYLDAREAVSGKEKSELEATYLLRKQRLLEFHERQRSELVELRRCLEYMSEHALVIEAALRTATGGVPLTSALLGEIAAMRRKMQQSINNAVHIRGILEQRHRPLMDELLRKMENELSNWTLFLNVASRSLANSGAVLENVHNLVVAQQKMCAQVSNSVLLAAEDEESPPREQQTVAQLSSTPVLDQLRAERH